MDCSPEPFIKLNTDGSSLGNPGVAGAGGLLCNSAGAWVSGFSLNMGIASNNISQLGAVCQGLILAWDLDFKFIYIKIDSMTVLSQVTTNDNISPEAPPLLCDCKNLMERYWTIQMNHIFCKANGYTDALAKKGNQQWELLEIYDTCSAFVYAHFVWDMENLGTNRMCPLQADMLLMYKLL